MKRLVLAALLARAALAVDPAAPTGLLTNGIRDPQAVDVAPPAISWTMNDPGRGEMQTAYQIVVTAEGKVFWDSGKILSAASSSVPYAGPPVAPATRHTWKVKLWDKDGHESPFSAGHVFDTGLSAADWTAAFIWDGTTERE
jgi:alpha-L-rhamnosidase